LSVQALADWRPGVSNYFEVANADQDASSGAECSLLFVAIAVKGLREVATKTHWRRDNCLRTGPKLDLEIDFNYGSRLTINSQ
jgi:hypothetical protein